MPDESQQKFDSPLNFEVKTVELQPCPNCNCVPTFCMTAESFWKLCGCGRERISREVVNKAREAAKNIGKVIHERT